MEKPEDQGVGVDANKVIEELGKQLAKAHIDIAMLRVALASAQPKDG